MVAALPCAIWQKELPDTLNATKWLVEKWQNLVPHIKFWDISPDGYVLNLRLAHRQGTLEVVEEIIKNGEEKNE